MSTLTNAELDTLLREVTGFGRGGVPSPLPEGKLVTVTGAARIVGVTNRTIYNWMARGRLEVLRTAGGKVRITVRSLFRPVTNEPLR